MPEGHTVHRAARRIARELGGRTVRAGSPQGRFAAGAGEIDGLRLEGAEALGKHLFCAFEGGEVLHVHLGLFGRLRHHRQPVPEPRGAVRLRMEAHGAAVDLSGPTACELVGEEGRERIAARLGPDPLRADADPSRADAALARRRIAVGAALLDQTVIAGLGNVYRAEVLFVCGIDPRREARSLSAGERRRVWETSARMLGDGLRSGRIVTVSRQELGVPPSRARRGERTYVYRQSLCRRCGGDVAREPIGARPCYWCPSCQT